jgi:hypothetical protein
MFLLPLASLLQSLHSVVRRAATFLSTPLEPPDESHLVEFLQHDKLPARSGDEDGEPRDLSTLGTAGSWRTAMTPSLAEKFDRWTKEKLAGTDFSNVFMII